MAPLANSRRSVASRRWRSTGARASGTRSASDWREVEDASAPGGLGRPTGPPGGLQQIGQVSLLSLLSFLILFCFLLMQICFNLVFVPNHF